MTSNYEIRKRAREVLGSGLFTAGWLYPVLIILIIGAISAALSTTFVGPILVTGILSVATAGYFIARVRGNAQATELSFAVESGKRNFVNSIIVSLLVSVFVAIGSLLFIIPGILFAYSFSMAYYVMNDRPELSPMEVLRESHRLMKGHRWQLFCLTLSFIGWAILGAFCFGIGSLWATAYLETATAVFYDELVNQDRSSFTVNE